MKKILCMAFAFSLFPTVVLASVEQYVQTVERINQEYKVETRQFFNSLDPRQESFTLQQQTQFCAIVGKYVNHLYEAADQNRSSLDGQFQNLTKQDVVNQVMQSKEMLILKKYNVKCNF